MLIMFKGLILIFILSVSSCTSVKIKSNNELNVTFSEVSYHQENFQFETTKSFFIWGNYPLNKEFNVDEELKKESISSASSVVVFESYKVVDVFLSIITFGLYLPKTYKVTGKTSSLQ